MYAPAEHDEITGLTGYIQQQLDHLRASLHGLTEAEAKATPCRSSLSVAALVKHAAYVLRGNVERLDGVTRALDEAGFSAYLSSLVVGEDEAVTDVLAEFDDARAAFAAKLTEADPDAGITEPPAPWDGIFDERPAKVRYLLVHVIEELARHAGHADIIREQIDGASVPALVLTLEGAAPSQFFQPFVAEPGTIGA